MHKRWQGVASLMMGATLLGGAALSVSAQGDQAVPEAHPLWSLEALQARTASISRAIGLDGESPVAAGTIDDGAALLPQAKITLEEAITAAQAAASGPIGEVDLEHFQGHLIFNVDVGDHDVKIDAMDGSVAAATADD